MCVGLLAVGSALRFDDVLFDDVNLELWCTRSDVDRDAVDKAWSHDLDLFGATVRSVNILLDWEQQETMGIGRYRPGNKKCSYCSYK